MSEVTRHLITHRAPPALLDRAMLKAPEPRRSRLPAVLALAATFVLGSGIGWLATSGVESGAASVDDAVRVIILTGAGRGFCAGADMNLLSEVSTAGGDARPHQREFRTQRGVFRGCKAFDVADRCRDRFGLLQRPHTDQPRKSIDVQAKVGFDLIAVGIHRSRFIVSVWRCESAEAVEENNKQEK